MAFLEELAYVNEVLKPFATSTSIEVWRDLEIELLSLIIIHGKFELVSEHCTLTPFLMWHLS
jgi:hypothetical protein